MSVYLTRGRSALLVGEMPGQDDVLFVNQRFDGGKLADARFSHCTFANVSFKDASLLNCHFTACVFEGCYFRDTKVMECFFPASRFIDCEFVKPLLTNSNFGYARFVRTLIPYTAMEASFPVQANVCRELASNLAVQAVALGNHLDARRYRLKSIAKREEALWRAVRWADDYSQRHYPSDLMRIEAFLQLVLSKLNGVLWGYGESVGRLLINLVALSTVVFPLLLLLAHNDLHTAGSIAPGDAWALSLATIVNNSGSSGIRTTGIAQAFVVTETLLGFVFFGLFVSYLFRAISRR